MVSLPRSLNSFIGAAKIQSVEFGFTHNDEISGTGDGQILTANVAPPLLTGTVLFAPMTYVEYVKLRARIDSLDGSLNSFYIYGPPLLYPQFDPTGSILGANSVSVYAVGSNNKSLRVMGLPPQYQLTEGDLFHYDFGTGGAYRAMHVVQEDITANASGITPLFEVRPHLFPIAAAIDGTGTALTFSKPTIKAIVVPKSLQYGNISGQFVTGTSFNFVQRLK